MCEQDDNVTVVFSSGGGGNTDKLWRDVFEAARPLLAPNKKSSREVLAYLEDKYPVERLHDERVEEIVALNASGQIYNDLPEGYEPEAEVYLLKNEGAGCFFYDHQHDHIKEWMDEVRSWDINFSPPPDPDYPDINKPEEWQTRIIVMFEHKSDFVAVEGNNRLGDELFAYQGLSEKELANPYLVYKYAAITGLLEER